MPHCYPAHPTFASQAEQDVWQRLVADLPDRATLIANWKRADAEGEYEADIIVVWPGQGVFLVEVKGGLVSLQPDGSWVSRDRNGDPHPIRPFEQALRNAHVIADFVEHEWSQGGLQVTWVVVFPHTDLPVGFSTAQASRDRIVDRQDLPLLVDTLKRLGRNQHGDNASAQRCELLVELLADLRAPQRALIEAGVEREQQVRRLTDEQLEKLDEMQDNARFAVVGPAGSGKTYLALEQARRRAAAGERVALVCYSFGLAQMLARATAQWPPAQQPAFVGTFHGLGALWGVTAPAGADSGWWLDASADAMYAQAQGLDNAERFDTLVVDEGQDFLTSWWRALTASLHDPLGGGLFVFGDMDQNVFDRDELRTLGIATSRLTRNMRNARPIAVLASRLTTTASRNLGIDGPDVRVIDCPRSEAHATADAVVEELLEEGWEGRDIALLTTHHQHGVQKEYQASAAADVLRRKHEYWDLFWEGEDVFFGTVTGFKGLERRVVVLAVDGFAAPERARELLYTGMTRARDLLVICGDRDDLQSAAGFPLV